VSDLFRGDGVFLKCKNPKINKLPNHVEDHLTDCCFWIGRLAGDFIAIEPVETPLISGRLDSL
jgi:hypothetical protein